MSKYNWTPKQLHEIAEARAERKRAKAGRKARGREKKRIKEGLVEYDNQSDFTNLPPHAWKYSSQLTR